MASNARGVTVVVSLIVVALCSATSDNSYDYDYGDHNYDYDAPPPLDSAVVARSEGSPPRPASAPLPLCCPPGHTWDYVACQPTPAHWTPHLHAAPRAHFAYTNGFPRCVYGSRAELYQTEVFLVNTTLYVPHYIQLHSIPAQQYCVVKISDPSSDGPAGGVVARACEQYSTKVYACVHGDRAMGPGAWTLVGVGHLLLLVCIVAHCLLPDLRALQGQYILCMVVTLLLYNLMLFPASAIDFPASHVACIALKAIKYFFFCGVFLWFSVVCFDVWRTLKRGEDVGGRRRFVLYSTYVWVLSAVLTTAVLVLSISTGAEAPASSPANSLPMCSLGRGVNLVLQLVQGATILACGVMLVLASCHLCHYTKLGCGLPRADATMCLKRTWKLCAVLVSHAVFSTSGDILNVSVIELWQFVVLESVAVFAVLVYRRSVLKVAYRAAYRRCFCCRDEGGDHDGGAGEYGPQSVMGGASMTHQPPLYPSQVPEKVRLSSV